MTNCYGSPQLYSSNRGPTCSIAVRSHPDFHQTQGASHVLYDAVVPAYLQILNSLTGELTKAEAHCEAKKIAPEVLLGSRLYPDMLPLTKQIQLVCDHASRAARG